MINAPAPILCVICGSPLWDLAHEYPPHGWGRPGPHCFVPPPFSLLSSHSAIAGETPKGERSAVEARSTVVQEREDNPDAALLGLAYRAQKERADRLAEQAWGMFWNLHGDLLAHKDAEIAALRALLDDFPIVTYTDRSDYAIIGWVRRWQTYKRARRALERNGSGT